MTPEQERILIGTVGMALCDMVTIARSTMPEGPERTEIVNTCLQVSATLLQLAAKMMLDEPTSQKEPVP